MKKILLVISLTLTFVFAKVDYSEMSTQELIAIIGYVEPQNKKDFIEELRIRIPTMSNIEKKQYENNLKKLK